ncbi:PqqD family protein [Lysinibacillus macroides]|uniref:Uncharacterized protein n=1 Tax=Lysinibacillus macroides TaxID=33935 RepID=A0A0N0CWK3_9BACI|nr:PqqD family protein [Lysinibacillus macroides]KOY83245.1 hypothetical protein ADM90_08180 [Lysinibacillus macroides]QPR69107.1 PqqD family protein [Lysinibacillus macroides]
MEFSIYTKYFILSEEEIIIINIVENSFYALDYIGSIIWREISKHQELEAIFKSLVRVFNVDKDEIYIDVTEFINELEKAGVIEIND